MSILLSNNVGIFDECYGTPEGLEVMKSAKGDRHPAETSQG
jgi:hypothetical protein